MDWQPFSDQLMLNSMHHVIVLSIGRSMLAMSYRISYYSVILLKFSVKLYLVLLIIWYKLSNCFLLWIHSHHKIRNQTFIAWWCCFYFSVTLQSKVGDEWIPTPCLHTNTTTSINNNGYIAWELMGKEAMKWVCFHNR